MSYLIDTTFAIDLLTNQPDARNLLPALRPDGFALTIFSYMELWEGVVTNRDPRAAARVLQTFLSGVPILPFSRRVARRAGRLRGELRALKRPIEQRAIDLLIAATALEHDLVMVTSDRDYTDIPGLSTLDPRTGRFVSP